MLAHYHEHLPDFDKQPIKIVVEGVPVAKGRARARIVTPRSKPQFISFYTPKETEVYEEMIAFFARQAMRGRKIIDNSCEMDIKAFIPVPESWSGKKSGKCLTGELKPPSKPDIDNYAKAALDGCNGIVFRDDALLWKITAEKHYSENPRLEIEVREYVPVNRLL